MEIERSGPNHVDRLLARLSGDDPDLRFRAEVVLGIGALQILTVGLLCISELVWGTTIVGVVCLVGLALILVILVDFCVHGRVARAANRIMAVLFLIGLILNVASGGRTIGVSIALPSLVLVGALALSPRGATLLFSMVVLQLLFIAGLDRSSQSFPIVPDPAWSEASIYRIPLLISVGTAVIGLLVRRAMVRHRRDLARTQSELAANEKKMREMFEFSRGLICTHSLEGVLLSVNPAIAQTLGYPVADLIGRNIAELMPENARAQFPAYLERVRNNEGDMGAIHINASDGSLRIWEYNNHYCLDADGSAYILGNATDMTERRKLEQRLREQSVRDPLTGCFNRRYLALTADKFASDQRWGCIVVDLDNFKMINDSRGHMAGDEILIAMGQFLNQHARSGDVVVRLGGDEFLLLLCSGGDGVTAQVADRLRHAASAGAPCDISIGHAERIDDETLEKTLERADRQLYQIRVAERSNERRTAPALS